MQYACLCCEFVAICFVHGLKYVAHLRCLTIRVLQLFVLGSCNLFYD